MKRAMLFIILSVSSMYGQFNSATTGSGTTNYIAKWSSSTNLTVSALCQSPSGGLVGVATCAPTQRLQVSSGDMVVKGLNNFAASGNLARYFVGDTNHTLGAAFGSGLFLSVYKVPYAMVIQDQTGFVGIGTSTPFSVVDIRSASGNNLNLLSARNDNLGASFIVNSTGQAFLTGGSPFAASLQVNGMTTTSGLNTESLVLSCCGFGSGTIQFPDGTIQTTAYKGTAATTNQSGVMQLIQRDHDNLIRLVQQLQARVAQLERAAKR